MAEKTVTVKIEGMSCDHCVYAVQSALEESDGISGVTVSLDEETAIVTYDPDWISTEKITDIIEEEGYATSF